MSGIYGNSKEDRIREKQLDDYLDSQYEGSDAQVEEWAAELTEQLLATGKQSPYISRLKRLIAELVADECDGASFTKDELSTITENHITAHIDNNYEEVRAHLYGPQKEDAA